MRLVLGKHLRAGSRIHTPVYLTVEIEKHAQLPPHNYPGVGYGLSPDYDVSDEDRIDVDDDDDDAFEEADNGDGVEVSDDFVSHNHVDSKGELRETIIGNADADQGADKTVEDAEPLHREQVVESPTQHVPKLDEHAVQKRKRAIFAALHRVSNDNDNDDGNDNDNVTAAPPHLTAVVPAQINNVIGLIDSAIDARLDTKVDAKVESKFASAIAQYDRHLNKLGAQSFKNEMLIKKAMLAKRKKSFRLEHARKNKLKRTKIAKGSSSSDNAASKSSSNAKGKLTAGVVGGVLGVGLGAAAMFTLLLNLD